MIRWSMFIPLLCRSMPENRRRGADAAAFRRDADPRRISTLSFPLAADAATLVAHRAGIYFRPRPPLVKRRNHDTYCDHRRRRHRRSAGRTTEPRGAERDL